MFRSLLLALLLVPSLAYADRVTVKGAVLEGKVKSISAKEIVMETVYGKGDLTIETADVTAIETDAPFHVYKSDDGTEVGRVVGVTPEVVSLAREDGGRAEIPFDQVQAAPRDPGPDASWLERSGVESPWWTRNVDLALTATEGTTDSFALAAALGALRERGPSRLKLGASYLRGTNQNDSEKRDPVTGVKDDAENITANELRGWIRQEYDLTKRVFAHGSFEAEHDGVESLKYRLIPKVGPGYKLVNTEEHYVAVDGGLAYVYEKFYDESLNNYLALALGGESKISLPWLGASWNTRADYLPSLTDWTNDYRLRGETALLIPLSEQLSFKTAVIDDYTAQPAEDTSANTLTTLMGLSLIY